MPLDLDPEKLEALAAGWKPAEVDLGRWDGLEMVTTIDHGMAVNAFLVWDPETREAVVFDTGWTSNPLKEILEAKKLQLTHLLITHSHRDHVADVAGLRTAFPKMKTLGAGDGWDTPPFESTLQIGRLNVHALATPGHAEDGVTYVVQGWCPDAPPVVLVGDVLFAGSMGGAREHLALAKKCAREHILSLPGGSLICPGHGPLTTVAEQLKANPFFLSATASFGQKPC